MIQGKRPVRQIACYVPEPHEAAVASLGQIIELDKPTPGLTRFYAMVAKAAEGWDGSDPIRKLG